MLFLHFVNVAVQHAPLQSFFGLPASSRTQHLTISREIFGDSTKITHGLQKEESLMDERTPKYTIANDYDPNGDLSADGIFNLLLCHQI
jgi:hypothetical protein